jgi:RHS repeat-associated protein
MHNDALIGYLSNENETPVEVYFDDFKVEHIKSPVIQMDDYYPFGLTFNSNSRENTTSNQYLYNGKERQDELDLGWLDYGARMYMPDIGRWGVVDPSADKYLEWSPFNYAIDNPINFIDPDGREVVAEKTERKKDGTKHVDTKITVTGKILDRSSIPDRSKAKALLGRMINDALNLVGDGQAVDDGQGGKVQYNITSVTLKFDIVDNMEQVSESDHLFVLVDNVVDDKDNSAIGVAEYNGKTAYVEKGSVNGNTGFHELGHLLGLGHENNTANTMNRSGNATGITPSQRLSVATSALYGHLNQGSNYELISATELNQMKQSAQNQSTSVTPVNFNTTSRKIPKRLRGVRD